MRANEKEMKWNANKVLQQELVFVCVSVFVPFQLHAGAWMLLKWGIFRHIEENLKSTAIRFDTSWEKICWMKLKKLKKNLSMNQMYCFLRIWKYLAKFLFALSQIHHFFPGHWPFCLLLVRTTTFPLLPFCLFSFS